MTEQFDTGRSRLQEWHRGHPERRIAGVCSTIAHQFGLALPLVRAGFLLAALLPGLNGVGLGVYAAMWFLTPPEPDAPSGLDRVVEAVSALTGDRRVIDESALDREERPFS